MIARLRMMCTALYGCASGVCLFGHSSEHNAFITVHSHANL
jgi:hypothetical protein